jgi:hypothetical protein
MLKDYRGQSKATVVL